MARSRQERQGLGVFMFFDVFSLAMLYDGSMFYSPFIIPVAGCTMVLGIVATSIWAGVRAQEIKSHERLARIAQGLPVEPEPRTVADNVGVHPVQTYKRMKINDGSGARRAGMVLVSVGVGLFAFFLTLAVIVQVRQVLAGGAAGLIPFAIGIGFLIDARLKRQDYERHLEWERSFGGAAGLPTGLGESRVPPPPPVGMTPAQASDWRPLH